MSSQPWQASSLFSASIPAISLVLAQPMTI
jgi:hypothetical protein